MAKHFLVIWLMYCGIANAMAVSVDINGVDKTEVEDNIRAHVGRLSLNEILELDAFWTKQIREASIKAVQPFGYYNSEIIVNKEADTLIIDVRLGEPLRIANLTREIIGEGRDDEAFSNVFNDFPLQVGDILHQPTYEAYKKRMFNYALTHGYFDFAWQATRLDLVRETDEANILLVAQSGPQYFFGDILIRGGDRATAIIERLKPFVAGDVYTAPKLTEFNQRLNQTGYFQRVIARPIVQDAADHRVPIEVTLEHKPKDSFNVGIGFSTDEKFRVPLQWRRPWVNSRGHSLLTKLFVTKREQSLSTDYRIPMQNVTDDYASIVLGYQFLDDEDRGTQSENLSLAGRRYWREEGSNWQRSFSLTYERESFTQGTQDRLTTQLLLPGVSYSYIDRGDSLDIQNGLLFVSSLQVGSQEVVSDIDVAKFTSRIKWIHTIGKHRFIVRGEAGAIASNDFSRVPATMRFFTGGDQSIRGFGFETIAPREAVVSDDEKPALLGGRYLTTASLEYAYPVAEKWRAAVFADAGTATDDFEASIARSVGVGAHWITFAGPVRFYLAFGKEDFAGNTVRFHFSLGPEL